MFFKFSSIWLEDFTHASGRQTQMSSSNVLIKEDFDGMATASSPSAGYCLAASKKSGGTHFICVVLGDSAEGRFTLARSKTGTLWPRWLSWSGTARPEGPEPTTATRLPLRTAGIRGVTHPFAKPFSMTASSLS